MVYLCKLLCSLHGLSLEIEQYAFHGLSLEIEQYACYSLSYFVFSECELYAARLFNTIDFDMQEFRSISSRKPS